MAFKINDEDSQTIDTIRAYAGDIDQTKSEIKTRSELIKELIERKPAFDKVNDLKEQLKTAQAELKGQLLRDSEYNDQMENLANDREKLKDQKDILSQHIALYWKNTGEYQVEMDDNTGDAREVLITGKLGKEGKYQTNMFPEAKAE